MDLCIHVANVLYLISFLARDILWLRTLTCGGLAFGIVFFTCQPLPLYGPTAWHVVFLGINIYQIRRLVLERRRLMLPEERYRAGEAAFRDLSRKQMIALLTRVIYRNPQKVGNMRKACGQQLSPDEQVLHDIAFSGLSRNDVLNLLTRRLWNSIIRLNPARWRRRRHISCAPALPSARISVPG
jgi:hypothetical protein